MPVSSRPANPGKNRLLDALPRDEFERLLPNLQQISFSLGDVVYEFGSAAQSACSKLSSRTLPRLAVKTPSPYDRTLTYRAGQSRTHQMFGIGEVTGLIDPQKIDVLFQDRLRRLIHAQGQM